MSTLGIIFSNLNENNLTRLTATRTVAAIPFACRYRLVDFPLSAMVNAGIKDVNIVTNYNFRSLSDHVGSGKDWDLARRGGGVTLVSPFRDANGQHAVVYGTHLEALLSMRESLEQSRADTVVMMDCDYVANVDLADLLVRHRASGARLTAVAYPCEKNFDSDKRRLMFGSNKDQLCPEAVLSDRYDSNHPLRAMNVYVLDMDFLLMMLQEASTRNYSSLSKDIFVRNTYSRSMYVYHYAGTVRHIGSFEDYYALSMELLENAAVRRELLEQEDRRIYTSVRNSAPVMYHKGAKVQNSMIADDCVIEGVVENSLLFRGVHVAKGAVVKNAVLFNNVSVGEGATINAVVADIGASVGARRVLSGCEDLPVYIDKERRV